MTVLSAFPRVRVRQLPHDATVPQLKAFFHGYKLARAEGMEPVELVRGPGGKVTGQALVWFESEKDALKATRDLNDCYLAGTSYMLNIKPEFVQ